MKSFRNFFTQLTQKLTSIFNRLRLWVQILFVDQIYNNQSKGLSAELLEFRTLSLSEEIHKIINNISFIYQIGENSLKTWSNGLAEVRVQNGL